jgi:hypothetical protein
MNSLALVKIPWRFGPKIDFFIIKNGKKWADKNSSGNPKSKLFKMVLCFNVNVIG